MAQEIERKFLLRTQKQVNQLIAKHISVDKSYKTENIIQFYIGQSIDFSTRIRITNQQLAHITIKSQKGGLSRYELNQEIPVSEAFEMLEISTSAALKKTRYKLNIKGYPIDMDVFDGALDGLLMAEIEFPDIEQANAFDMAIFPEFYREVTNNSSFINANLIGQSFPNLPV
jgi:CYTH domain-containing protein